MSAPHAVLKNSILPAVAVGVGGLTDARSLQ